MSTAAAAGATRPESRRTPWRPRPSTCLTARRPSWPASSPTRSSSSRAAWKHFPSWSPTACSRACISRARTSRRPNGRARARVAARTRPADARATARAGRRGGADGDPCAGAARSDRPRAPVEGGAVAGIGHTNATHEQASAAFDAGATVATHLFNAMPAPSSHEPAGAALDDARVTVELINDGVHVPDTMARTAARAAGPERFALITDAISATGMPDGLYQLGALKVNVNQGIVRLEDGSTLAGSTLTMDAALRRAVRDLGLPIEDAVRSASTTPA